MLTENPIVRQGLHRRRYHVPGFRVLTFTLTPARAKNLSELPHSTLPAEARRLFYFAALSELSLEEPQTLFNANFWHSRDPNPTQRYSFLPKRHSFLPV